MSIENGTLTACLVCRSDIKYVDKNWTNTGPFVPAVTGSVLMRGFTSLLVQCTSQRIHFHLFLGQCNTENKSSFVFGSVYHTDKQIFICFWYSVPHREQIFICFCSQELTGLPLRFYTYCSVHKRTFETQQFKGIVS